MIIIPLPKTSQWRWRQIQPPLSLTFSKDRSSVKPRRTSKDGGRSCWADLESTNLRRKFFAPSTSDSFCTFCCGDRSYNPLSRFRGSVARPPETFSVATNDQEEIHAYSVWAVPPEDVAARLKTVMSGLRSEFAGPQFEPHITVVGLVKLSQTDAIIKFMLACEGLKAYDGTFDRVAAGASYNQCVFLLIHPTAQVVETYARCSTSFGVKISNSYMPHLSLLYGDLSDQEKEKAVDRASDLDPGINSLSFPITRLALYKTDSDIASWEKIAEYNLGSPN